MTPSPARPAYLRVLLRTALAATVLAAAYMLTRPFADSLLNRFENATSPCRPQRLSNLATRYLENLHGVEIGASTENSFGLKRSINVDFSDEQGGLWQSPSCAPAVVNIVASGDDLPFKSDTLDYVLSSHVIEHFFDPVKALKEWHRVIRPGGYIFLIAPHRDRTFDNHREPTPVAELLARHSGEVLPTHYARPLDPAAVTAAGKHRWGPDWEAPVQVLVKDRKQALEPGWVYYAEDDHHHWSVWRTADFLALVRQLGFAVVEYQDVDDKVGNGFTVVIRKPPATPAAGASGSAQGGIQR